MTAVVIQLAMIAGLFGFLAIYYRLMWHIEIQTNDKIQDQKARLIRRVRGYQKFIRKKTPDVYELSIRQIETEASHDQRPNPIQDLEPRSGNR